MTRTKDPVTLCQGCPRAEEEGGAERELKEIMAENSRNLGIDLNL